MLDYIPVLQEWQLHKLLDILAYQYKEISQKFPGFFTKAYYIRPEGIDWVELVGRRLRVVKTMSKAELQRDRDMFFTQPHRAIQVPAKNKVLTIGFWCEDPKAFLDWLMEQFPDVDTVTDTERVFSRQIYLDGVVHTDT